MRVARLMKGNTIEQGWRVQCVVERLELKKAAKAANIATYRPKASWQPWQPWQPSCRLCGGILAVAHPLRSIYEKCTQGQSAR